MKNFNYILIIITIVILAAMGIAFIGGTIYSSIQTSDWTQTIGYEKYLENMNSAILPLTIALVITLSLCIPKRLFSGQTLLIINSVLLLSSLIIAILVDPQSGLGFALIIAALMQIVVIVLTVMGSKKILYEKSGFFIQIGSAMLHLGLIIFMYDFLLLLESPNHINIFWVCSVLIGVGMIFSFYSQEFSKLFKRGPNNNHNEELY